ncbi:MAG: ABC-F family ATP-binding cassette domain-containing protein [Oscillospiraceae bacterium]|jgi:ATP-binding cassette subfamily F protein 3
MTDVSIQNLVKSFEQDKNILDGLSFDILEGERVGILGKNGAGKTTLFRILTGEVRPDEGSVSIASGKRLGLISQIPVYPDDYTVEDVLKTAHARIFELEAEMARLSEQMAVSSDEALMREYDRAAAEYESRGGYNAETERNRIANGLDISPEMRKQLFADLSGGEKTRVNLARLIIEDTDILLLDEPTNHLDLRATEWLEEYLQKFHGTVLAISHDRYFLDRTVTRCIEIKNGKAEFYSGNYSFYAAEKRRRYEEQLKRYEKEQAKIKQLEAAADQMHLWAFMGNDALHKRAFSMEKRIERIRQTERPQSEKKLSLRFAERDFEGDEVLVLDGVKKSFGERTLFSGLELLIKGGERIALLGDNGTGKSTLIKMIMGEEPPDEGLIRLGPSVKAAYLPQIIHFDHPERTLLDTLLYSEKITPQAARTRLGSFRFSGDDVFKPVAALSGGEQSRLRLCTLMRDEVNFLILDEPTNHLDIQSREWIEDAVADYGEALLFVSHDRYFIEKFATRIWMLENGTITDFRGSFSEYRAWRARQEELAAAEKAKEVPKAKPPKPSRKAGSGGTSNEKLLQKSEREIERLEAQMAELDAQVEANASDYKKLMELDEQKAALQAQLDEAYDRWAALSD